ncbi:MAG: PqqD family protein [Candidatus Hodarchaeales archaeon]|jgi:hypothetical protein
MVSLKGSKSKKKSKGEKKKQLVVSKEEFFKLKPVVSPFAHVKKQTPEELLIELDISEFKKERIVRRIIPTPDYKRILLDKLGMFVFLLCDGNHNVQDIYTEFHEKYRLTLAESQASVQKYLMSLAQRHLIGFIIPKKLVKEKQLMDNKIDKIVIEAT